MWSVLIDFKRLLSKVGEDRKYQLGGLLVIGVLTAFAEVMVLAGVVQLVSSLTSTSGLSYEAAQGVPSRYEWIDMSSPVRIGVYCISVSVLSCGLRTAGIWATGKFTAGIGGEIASSLYIGYMRRRYEDASDVKSSDLITIISADVNRVVTMSSYVIRLGTGIFLSVAIFIYLLIVDWKVSVISALVLSSCYGLMARSATRESQRMSKLVTNQMRRQIGHIQESIGALREVNLAQLTDCYGDVYNQIDYRVRQIQARTVLIADSPKAIMETLVIVLIVLLILASTATGTAVDYFPTLAGLAVGFQRLIPGLQQCYSSATFVSINSSSLARILEFLTSNSKCRKDYADNESITEGRSLPFADRLSITDCRYMHKAANEYILDGACFEVVKGEFVGIVGKTGAGKSTLGDIFMGLISSWEGSFVIDGRKIDIGDDITMRNWSSKIAIVPQNVFLVDGDLIDNIAFGSKHEVIDQERVVEAAKIACIHEFIDSLPDQYFTKIGENGNRLSGGQRQRIGIARALYRNKEILVLDEATSALDQGTELKLIKSLERMKGKKTIIAITHRPAVLDICDSVYEVKNRLVYPTDRQA